MYNPEQSFLNEYTLKEKPLTEEESFIQGELVTKYNKERPKLKDFPYPEEEIKRDKERIIKIKKGFQYEKTQRAEILEAIINDQVDQAEWFGPCYIIPSSEYDDIINHTDSIIEFEKENKTYRLAIDITVSKNKADLDKKRKFIQKDIKSY